MKNRKNIAVFASGNGSNFKAIAEAIKSGKLPVQKCLLITDKKNCLARKKAKAFQIKDIFINPSGHKSRKSHEQEILKILRQEEIEVIILAGYMRILSPFFLSYFKNKILNIHPSLLPSFAGKDAIARAFNYGCKITGVTVHFVNRKIDGGPIIAQKSLAIKKGISLKNLEKEIHKIEHRLYPKALKLFLNNRLKICGRNVKIC